jgi:hypothetical protein
MNQRRLKQLSQNGEAFRVDGNGSVSRRGLQTARHARMTEKTAYSSSYQTSHRTICSCAIAPPGFAVSVCFVAGFWLLDRLEISRTRCRPRSEPRRERAQRHRAALICLVLGQKLACLSYYMHDRLNLQASSRCRLIARDRRGSLLGSAPEKESELGELP